MNSKLLVATLVGGASALLARDGQQDVQEDNHVRKEITGRLFKNESNQWLVEWRGMVDGSRKRLFYSVSELDVERLERANSVPIFFAKS